MVSVDHDSSVSDVGDREHAALFVVADLFLELHADLDVVGKAILRFYPDELRVVLAEGIVRLEHDRARIAGTLFGERRLDLRKDAVVAAVQVGNRVARFLDQLARHGVELVSERDDGVV